MLNLSKCSSLLYYPILFAFSNARDSAVELVFIANVFYSRREEVWVSAFSMIDYSFWFGFFCLCIMPIDCWCGFWWVDCEEGIWREGIYITLKMSEGKRFQLGTIGALSLSVVSSVSIVICNKALISTLGFCFGQCPIFSTLQYTRLMVIFFTFLVIWFARLIW